MEGMGGLAHSCRNRWGFAVHLLCRNGGVVMDMTQAQQALRDIELQTVQARIANGIGRKSAKRQVAFLLGALEQIRATVETALQEQEVSC